MAVKIRLRRMGKKKAPFYRVVVAKRGRYHGVISGYGAGRTDSLKTVFSSFIN